MIEELRDQLWLHVSPTATRHDTALHAAALLQLPYNDIERLGALHFVLDPAVSALLDDGPALLRRLASDTRPVIEIGVDRVRGPVDWPATARRRALDRTPVLVTHPQHRDSDVQPNRTLALVLQAVRDVGTGLTASAERQHAMAWQAADIQRRAAALAAHRALIQVTPSPPSARDLVAMRAPRVRRRHATLLDAWQAYDNLVRQADAHAVRAVVEQRGFAVAENGALFELLVLFRMRAALADGGWAVQQGRVFGGHLRFSATRRDEALDVWYQGVPAKLRRTSAYTAAQRAHALPGAADLRPDLVLALRKPGQLTEWLIVEAKTTHDHTALPVLARRALVDLLAYRSAYTEHLHRQHVWGLGVVWGSELRAAPDHEVGLCTPDRLADAVAAFTDRPAPISAQLTPTQLPPGRRRP
ncbi:hypothetical protein [Pseudonocardia alni]|uniref:hypothetical protein n=1 Tax=Pseudonocardia alni TaxID=33907 RepID=UPI00279F9EDA|nr:hypothetical protein PaSha_01445 [Pseudonocardia alni]